ncbi:MAG: hypothetical protein QOE35_3175 [Actinomycetota bacterium]
MVDAFAHPTFIVDDWLFAVGARFHWWHAYAANAGRPVGALWNAVQFVALGASPVRHVVLLAVLNGLVGVLLWELAAHVLPRRLAVLTVVVWMALANRGSTHYWASTAPSLAVLAAVLGLSLFVASSARWGWRQHATVVVVLSASALLYEGGLGLGLVVAGASAWRFDGRRRWIALLTAGLGLSAALGWSLVESPKTGGVSLFLTAGRLVSAHVGAGVVPGALVAPTVGLVAAAVAWSVSAAVLPSFAARDEERMILFGSVLVIAGAAPFFGPGFPIGTEGLNDRANLYADVGTALVFAAIIGLAWRLPARPVAVALASAAVVALGTLQLVDLRAYRDAGRDARQLLAAIDRLPVGLRTRGPLRLAEPPNRDGVAAFYADYDIASALRLRYGIHPPLPDVRIDDGPEVWRLDGDRLVAPR